MNLIISFSARENGNCGHIAEYIKQPDDNIVHFKNIDMHSCSNCAYECFFDGICKYRADEVYALFESMREYDKVFLIVPIYCGNPSSLYFIFNERGQDYFMHNSDTYTNIANKLYIIGVYGSQKESPDFMECFAKWFESQPLEQHLLGIQRRPYQQRISDSILEIAEVKNSINAFIR